MRIRLADASDLEALTAMRTLLWPEGSAAEHRAEVRAFFAGEVVSTLPLAVFVAELGGAVIGFVAVGLRSHADGCDTKQACGFIEGWYVVPEHQRHGAGRLLIERAEQWSREHGCVELASDTWIDNEPSQHAHLALGFELVDRCVNYKKSL